MWRNHKKEVEHNLVMISGIFLHSIFVFLSNLSSFRRKYLSDVLTDKILLSCGPKVSKKPLKIRYWWLKNREKKFHFRFVARRFLAANNSTLILLV